MSRLALACGAAALLLLAAPRARADEGADAAKKVLAALEQGFDQRLGGKRHFGVYMNGKSLGTVVIEVERAPADSGAVYRERVAMDLAFGPDKIHHETLALFDARLGLIRSEQLERETHGEQTKETKTVTRREGEGWLRERTADGETKTLKAEGGGDNHEESLMLMVLATGTKPGRYAFRGVKWSKGGEAGVWQPLTLEVAEAAEVEHRGAKLKGFKVSGTKGAEEPMQMVISAEGKILRMHPPGAPFEMVAGTAEEAKRDLGGGEATDKDVLAAIELYFRVLAADKPIDDLDKVLDWAAIKEWAAKKHPETANVSVEDFAKATKADIERRLPALPADKVPVVVSLCKVTVKGNEAEVLLPGNKKTLLRKNDAGRWLIYSLPQ
ncbi:MAG: hypothetical protein AB7T09_26160 [Planctomycetota bacterium]